MIKERKDGILLLSFDDWTDDMKALSIALAKLTKRHNGHERLHDIGIDRLSCIKHGKLAIRLLTEQVPELSVRPTANEVVELGKMLLRICVELGGVQNEVRRERLVRLSRQHWRGPTKKYRFVRKAR
jgi:hypothetical protein